MNSNSSETICSFCLKSKTNNPDLFFIKGASIGAHICDCCADLCIDLIKDERRSSNHENAMSAMPSIVKPNEIYEFLNDHVIDQDEAKKQLAVAMYNHQKRILSKSEDSEIPKSNVLMIGPTGSGKTLLAEKIAQMLDVPFAIADATTLTEAGYVGEDVESIIRRLLTKADNNVAKAENGIVFIDEIDKIAAKGRSSSTTNEVGSQGVQQALLKLIEGTEINVQLDPGRRIPDKASVSINTKNILFICSGAFSGIDTIVNRNTGSQIGFKTESSGNKKKGLTEAMRSVEQEDLVKYGMIPEFVGRLPAIVSLDELTEDSLCRILKEPKNSITEQYQRLFKYDDIELEITDCAIKAVARKAIERKIGARGLRSIFEASLRSIMFEAPNMKGLSKVIIDAEAIDAKKASKFEYNKTQNAA